MERKAEGEAERLMTSAAVQKDEYHFCQFAVDLVEGHHEFRASAYRYMSICRERWPRGGTAVAAAAARYERSKDGENDDESGHGISSLALGDESNSLMQEAVRVGT